MKPQDLPAVQTSAASFVCVIEDALIELNTHQQTYAHALSIGIRPVDLVRYVKGDLSNCEHNEVMNQLGASQWAMERVVALVKAKRDETSLRYRSVCTQILNHYARSETWEDAKLLDTL